MTMLLRRRLIFPSRKNTNITIRSRSASSSASSVSTTDVAPITVRLVSINDVYDLNNLPRLATLIQSLGRPKSKESNSRTKNSSGRSSTDDFDTSIPPSAVTLNGDFLSPSSLTSIDNGRGHVASLRASGITHVCLGNHEADLLLGVIKDRLSELSRRDRVTVLNSNVNGLGRYTKPVDVVASRCGKIKVGLLGLLSDEHGMFRDGTFRGLTIENVKKQYAATVEKSKGAVDWWVPLTHQSLRADEELAEWMMKFQQSQQPSGGVILGGHEHVKIHSPTDNSSPQIIKAGQNCERAAIVDLQFHPSTHSLLHTSVHFEELGKEQYLPCPVVETVVKKHLSAMDQLQDFVAFDKSMLPVEYFVHPITGQELPLSSEHTRYEQTTVGAFFCTAIKSELGADVCIINGAPIKANMKYPSGKMSYKELRNELPFPLKMVVVPMPRRQLRDAIEYSRTNVENGKPSMVMEDGRVERRGYLQVDFEYWQPESKSSCGNGGEIMDEVVDDDDHVLSVALPRNLLKGFCKIQPLIDLGNELESTNALQDDYIKAVDLIVRYCCKDRWATIAQALSFADIDENHDGTLSREEIRTAIQRVLGEDEPSEALVESMVDAIDEDANGLVDEAEFNKMISRVRQSR